MDEKSTAELKMHTPSPRLGARRKLEPQETEEGVDYGQSNLEEKWISREQ